MHKQCLPYEFFYDASATSPPSLNSQMPKCLLYLPPGIHSGPHSNWEWHPHTTLLPLRNQAQ